MFSASDVKDVREKTGAGMMDCKKALEACEGNMEKAIDWLREKGIAKADKKASRIAAEGLAQIFINGNKAVVIEVNSETDFVSKNAEFTDMINMNQNDNCVISRNKKQNNSKISITQSQEVNLKDIHIKSDY